MEPTPDNEGNVDLTDQRIGGYAIHDVLGLGGMGVVYRAIDTKGDQLAVKVLPAQWAANPRFRQRFMREVKAAAALSSPFLVGYRDGGDDHGRLFLAMELMPGGNAEEATGNHGGRLPPMQAAAICRDAAEGLEAIHAAGMVHRDIKPANIFLTADGRAKLGDFGIVRSNEDTEHMTIAGNAIGTPSFMAPEQAQGDPRLDIRADIYALGATLYYLIVGRAPFLGSSAWMVISQSLNKPLPDPRQVCPDCPAALAAIVRCAGNLDREKRYATPLAMREDLEAMLTGKDLPHGERSTAESPIPAASATAVSVRRLLIVDDDPMLCRMHQAVFTAAGYAVAVANDGKTALERVASFNPTVMLLDLGLPEIEGPEVIRRIRSDPKHRSLPILVLSNAFFAEERQAASDAGADVIISKVDHGPQRVVEVVGRLLSSGGQAETPRKPAAAIDATIAAAVANRHQAPLDKARQLVNQLADTRSADVDSLVSLADALRSVADFATAGSQTYVSILASTTEALARQLHGLPTHVNPDSVGTLKQAVAVLCSTLDGPQSPPEPVKYSVLVVDDDSITRQIMAQTMRKVGVRVESAADAVTALGMLRCQRYDLVLSDLLMDGMDGYQFIIALRQVLGYAITPVIFVTGLSDVDEKALTSSGSAVDVITKPFLPMELATKSLCRLLPLPVIDTK